MLILTFYPFPSRQAWENENSLPTTKSSAACSASYPTYDATIIPMFAVLLDEGGLDVNHWLEVRGDILKVAVDQGNIEFVKYLFSKGADPNYIVVLRALRAAAEYGNLDAVKMVLEMKSDEVELEEADYISDFAYTQYPEVTALYKAAGEGHSAIVDVLVRNGANIDFKDASGRSVIDIARVNGHKNLAIRLEQLMSLDPSEKGLYTNQQELFL
ncbi:MAG: hypothetical protein Q9198_005533 [Flavoplaca austrocitrina]